MVFLKECIGINIMNATTFFQNHTAAVFCNFWNIDRFIHQICVIIFNHFFDFVDVTRESHCRRQSQTAFVTIVVTQRNFPTAVFYITCLQVNLLVTCKFGQFSQECLVLSIRLVISNFRTQFVPQTQAQTKFVRFCTFCFKIGKRIDTSFLNLTTQNRCSHCARGQT